MNLSFHSLTPDRWQDFEKLFVEKGACAGCWFMYWLMSKKDYDKKRNEKHSKK